MDLPEIVAGLLAARGIGSVEEAKRFLHPSLDQLHPPMEMLGMRTAVERLERAIAQREPILIYGDYDVDGTMATVILKTVVELLGGQCAFHVPHRLREGYGMRDEVIGRAAADGIRLIISVDTGIRAFAEAETAAQAGVDLIVTDHHLVAQAEGVPRALAVLNPNQSDCRYPCKYLCGAGVAFKVAQALLERVGRARQVEEQRISEAVLRQVEESSELRDAACMVVEGEGWHRGVIGICAARVVERFGRPAVVISRDGDEAHGSGRSIPGFHLLQALETAPELFLRFGGHAGAVGFAMRAENVDELRRRLNEYAKARLGGEPLRPALEFDGELKMEQVTPRFWEQLRSLQPFGMGNPEPVFVARGVTLMGQPKVMREKHLKLKLRRYVDVEQGALTRGLDALGWRMAHRLEAEPLVGGEVLDVLFRIEQNTHPDFGGGLQLVLSDFRRAEDAGEAGTHPDSQ
jgi:single-stranded DNA-specific DHH superfamily exonuclease